MFESVALAIASAMTLAKETSDRGDAAASVAHLRRAKGLVEWQLRAATGLRDRALASKGRSLADVRQLETVMTTCERQIAKLDRWIRRTKLPTPRGEN